MNKASKKVDEYVAKQDEPKKTLLYEARLLIFKNIPGCKEEFKWGVPVYDGGKFYIAAMKTRVHMGFAITGLNETELKQFEGAGKTMRHIKISSMDDLEENKISKLIELVRKKATVPADYK